MPESSNHRHNALIAAVQAHPNSDADTIIDAAHKFHAFLANGDGAGAAPAATPVRATPGRPRAAPAAVAANPVAPAPAKAAPAPAPVKTTTRAPAAAPATVPSTHPAPTTIAEAAASLKALVQSKEPGRGRAVAVALLAEYGVEQLAQIPPAKLAEFKHRLDTAGYEDQKAEATAEPEAGDDLLG